MIIVDTALKARAEAQNPVRVGLIGAGFMAQGLTNMIVNSTPGMRVVAISNRNPERAMNVFAYAGKEAVRADDRAQVRGGRERRPTDRDRRPVS